LGLFGKTNVGVRSGSNETIPFTSSTVRLSFPVVPPTRSDVIKAMSPVKTVVAVVLLTITKSVPTAGALRRIVKFPGTPKPVMSRTRSYEPLTAFTSSMLLYSTLARLVKE
jgi:hypothetical protein